MEYNNPNDYWMRGHDPDLDPDDAAVMGCLYAVTVGSFIAVGIAAAVIIFLLSGCKPQERVIVDIQHVHDTTYVAKHTRDSIYLSDSIYISDFVRDDTVWRTVVKWRTHYRDRLRTDTLWRERRDTVQLVAETVREVPAQLTWWQQTRLHLANILLYILLIYAAVKAGRVLIKNSF